MANKITQLVNKNGDNLYPLAGGIMSDSVTTDMIQDGAVTSDKIDSATIIVPDMSVVKATLPNQSVSAGGGTVSNVVEVPESGFLLYNLTTGGTGCAAQIKHPNTNYRYANIISTNWTQTSGIMPVCKGQMLDLTTIASSSAGASITDMIIFGSQVQ